MPAVHAVYENGVFKPKEPVSLPEACEVEFEPRLATPPAPAGVPGPLQGVYAVLSQRFASGETDVAAWHGEHQP
jgi:predicted DNA-binding antitoxin AbrB/MazE fold protein